MQKRFTPVVESFLILLLSVVVSGLAILDSLLFFNHKEVNVTRPREFVMLSTQPIAINITDDVFFTAHYYSWYPGRVVASFFTSCQLFVYFRRRAFGFGMTCGLTPSK